MQLPFHNSLFNIKPDGEEINPLEWRKTMTAIGALFVAAPAQYSKRHSAHLVLSLSYISWLEFKRSFGSGLCWRCF